jgi:hypothetical protein
LANLEQIGLIQVRNLSLSPADKLKRLQVVEFEGDFLFEIFPQFYGLFNLMFGYQIVGRFEVYQKFAEWNLPWKIRFTGKTGMAGEYV